MVYKKKSSATEKGECQMNTESYCKKEVGLGWIGYVLNGRRIAEDLDEQNCFSRVMSHLSRQAIFAKEGRSVLHPLLKGSEWRLARGHVRARMHCHVWIFHAKAEASLSTPGTPVGSARDCFGVLS